MTVIEKIVDEISFNCDTQPEQVVLDSEYIEKQTKDLRKEIDLSRFII